MNDDLASNETDPVPEDSDAYARAIRANPQNLRRIRSALEHSVEGSDELVSLMTAASGLLSTALSRPAHAGLTAAFDGTPFTVAPTDDRVSELDQLQYSEDDGPCLRAMRSDRTEEATLDEADALWPTFARYARAVNVTGFLAAPLHASARPVGSLNVYYSGPTGTGESGRRDDRDLTTVIGLYLDVALTDYGKVRTFRHAASALLASVEERALIDAAIGTLMARDEISDDDARRVLDADAEANARSRYDTARHIVGLPDQPPTDSA